METEKGSKQQATASGGDATANPPVTGNVPPTPPLATKNVASPASEIKDEAPAQDMQGTQDALMAAAHDEVAAAMQAASKSVADAVAAMSDLPADTEA